MKRLHNSAANLHKNKYKSINKCRLLLCVLICIFALIQLQSLFVLQQKATVTDVPSYSYSTKTFLHSSKKLKWIAKNVTTVTATTATTAIEDDINDTHIHSHNLHFDETGIQVDMDADMAAIDNQSQMKMNNVKWPLITTANTNAHPDRNRKCDMIFGNGFSQQLLRCSSASSSAQTKNVAQCTEENTVCDDIDSNTKRYLHVFEENSSDFECYQNPVSQAMYCTAKNLIINPKQIRVSKGGEHIKHVMNRRESQEFPIYHKPEKGQEEQEVVNIMPALSLDNNCFVEKQFAIPAKPRHSFYMYDIIENVVLHQQQKQQSQNSKTEGTTNYCSSDDKNGAQNNDKKKVTLLTMRYEYANFYHTATDWYNMYQIIHSLLGNDTDETMQISVVFLDGHSQSSLDNAWKLAFAEDVQYVKQLSNGSVHCIPNAIFIPAGYTGGISLQTIEKHQGVCNTANAYVQQFRKWFLRNIVAFDELPNTNIKKQKKTKIGIICRKDYLAHPRNLKQKTARKFANDESIEQMIVEEQLQIREQQPEHEFSVERLYFEDMSIEEQLRTVSGMDILVAVHGAGLTHALFLPPNSVVLEIIPPSRRGNKHFEYIAKWCGHTYIVINARESGDFVHVNEQQLRSAVKEAMYTIVSRN